MSLTSKEKFEFRLCKEAVAILKYLPPLVVALEVPAREPALLKTSPVPPPLDIVPGLATPVIGLPLDVVGLNNVLPPEVAALSEVPGLGIAAIE